MDQGNSTSIFFPQGRVGCVLEIPFPPHSKKAKKTKRAAKDQGKKPPSPKESEREGGYCLFLDRENKKN